MFVIWFAVKTGKLHAHTPGIDSEKAVEQNFQGEYTTFCEQAYYLVHAVLLHIIYSDFIIIVS